MVSADTLSNYPYWTIYSNVHTGDSDKQLVSVISKNKKPISFFLIQLSKPRRNYTTT